VRFETLFDDHARDVLAFALRRVVRPEDAADVTAETFLVAWRRLDGVPHGDEARPWLFGVARKVISNQTRSELRRDRLGAKLREQLTGIEFDHADDVATSSLVRDALSRLPDDDRELLRLTAWEGLAPTEIATVMSIPAATVRTRLHRARERMRHELVALGHVVDGERVLAVCDEGES